jgi:adenosylmethionine-8-amino-7-oxononanoate aminotransferase
VFNQAYAPLLFDVGTIPFPRAGGRQETLDALECACRSEAPAAFIVEPLLLGAGGMLVYDAATLAEMRAICAAHDVLFIADEVMTGWGRTGTLLACEQADIVPDLLCLAKGLTGGSMPLAVTLASEPIYEAHWSRDRARMFYHSSSYTANPIACAAALANLEVWREEPVAERIAALAQRQSDGLARLAKVPGVTNPRQCGTVIALDYTGGGEGYLADLGPRLLAFFRERDLLVRPLGNTAYVMPPYCIEAEDLARVHEALGEAARL